MAARDAVGRETKEAKEAGEAREAGEAGGKEGKGGLPGKGAGRGARAHIALTREGEDAGQDLMWADKPGFKESFDVRGMSTSTANAIRSAMLSYVDVVFADVVHIHTNTSATSDEILGSHTSSIPIVSRDVHLLRPRGKCDCSSHCIQCAVYIGLNVVNRNPPGSKRNVYVTDRDMMVVPAMPSDFEAANATPRAPPSTDTWPIAAEPPAAPSPKVRIPSAVPRLTDFPNPITILAPGEHIHLTLVGRRTQPVESGALARTAVRVALRDKRQFAFNAELMARLDADQRRTLVAKCPKAVFDIESNVISGTGERVPGGRGTIERVTAPGVAACSECGECDRLLTRWKVPGALVRATRLDCFEFRIETNGALTPRELFSRSTAALLKRVSDMRSITDDFVRAQGLV